MPLIIVPRREGGSGGSETSELTNLSTLSKLSTSSDGKLLFNGKVVSEKSIEVAYNVELSKNQSSIELPNDCDTSRVITLSINGISLERGTFWEVIEKEWPEKDLIAWSGLELENLAQAGDKILITYYKKV